MNLMTTIYVDENRILQRAAAKEKITGKWREAVDAIVETCKTHLGDRLISVYVGGSVAHGNAQEGKSDVDAYAIADVSKEEIEKLNQEWVEEERKKLDLQFPFQRGVELHLIPIDGMSEGKKFQMKVFSAWVYGKNFDAELPDYKLDRETLGRIRVNIAKDIETARKELNETSDTEEIKRISTWISKRLIRSAGMLCLWKENFFTMDIDTLVPLVKKNYPGSEKELEALHTFTRNPPGDKEIISDLLKSFGSWLIKEDKETFKPAILFPGNSSLTFNAPVNFGHIGDNIGRDKTENHAKQEGFFTDLGKKVITAIILAILGIGGGTYRLWSPRFVDYNDPAQTLTTSIFTIAYDLERYSMDIERIDRLKNYIDFITPLENGSKHEIISDSPLLIRIKGDVYYDNNPVKIICEFESKYESKFKILSESDRIYFKGKIKKYDTQNKNILLTECLLMERQQLNF